MPRCNMYMLFVLLLHQAYVYLYRIYVVYCVLCPESRLLSGPSIPETVDLLQTYLGFLIHSSLRQDHRVIWTRKLLAAAKVGVGVRVGICMECRILYLPANYGRLRAQVFRQVFHGMAVKRVE